MADKILFDFDGVMMDSVGEMMIPAYNAATGEEARTSADLPDGYATRFRLNRPHLRPAGEAIPLAKLALALTQDREVTAAEWQEALAREPGGSLERAEKFFAARARLIEFSRGNWVRLNQPYPTIWKALQQDPERVLILTNKNRAAVKELLSHFELPLPDQQIFSGDHGQTKEKNLDLIREHFGDTEYLFLEDALGNLVDVHQSAPQNIIPLLASWGYVRNDDLLEAARLGIEVVSEAEFVTRFWTQ